MRDGLRIGELASRCGVSRDTIRFLAEFDKAQYALLRAIGGMETVSGAAR